MSDNSKTTSEELWIWFFKIWKFWIRGVAEKQWDWFFIYYSFYFFFQTSLLPPSKLVPLGSHTPMETLFPTFGGNAGGLKWSSACSLHSWPSSFLYKDVLERLRKRVILPCHTALSVTEFLTSKGIPVVPQPPSPDLSPCGCPQRTSFWDFRKHRKKCNGHAEDHTGWRLPALLPKVGKTSLLVCSYPRELFWKG